MIINKSNSKILKDFELWTLIEYANNDEKLFAMMRTQNDHVDTFKSWYNYDIISKYDDLLWSYNVDVIIC